jgi:hypothetical protein
VLLLVREWLPYLERLPGKKGQVLHTLFDASTKKTQKRSPGRKALATAARYRAMQPASGTLRLTIGRGRVRQPFVLCGSLQCPLGAQVGSSPPNELNCMWRSSGLRAIMMRRARHGAFCSRPPESGLRGRLTRSPTANSDVGRLRRRCTSDFRFYGFRLHLSGAVGVPGFRAFSMSAAPLAVGGDSGGASPSYTSNRPCFCRARAKHVSRTPRGV